MRCIALADAVAAKGGRASFICRLHQGHLANFVRARGFGVSALPPAPARQAVAADADYAAWLGVSQEQDAEETIGALGGQAADWIVVDHYSLDATWERRLREHTAHMLVISDLAGTPHDCDIFLNQNYGAEQRAATAAGAGRPLLGARYALLRPEFAAHRDAASARNGLAGRVFVFFGGADQGNLTALALKVLSKSPLSGIEADVVIGANTPYGEMLANLAAERRRTSLHRDVSDMAALMARSDFAIGAGGTTTLERLCVGLPSIVISAAANQVPACEALARDRLIVYLGSDTEIDVAGLRNTVRQCVSEPAALADMANRGSLAVDGLGARRLAEFLIATPTQALRLRPARQSDAIQYIAWANDPEVRRQSMNRESISWPGHQAWFAQKLAADASRLFVLEAGNLPVGQIRFDRVGDEHAIDYSIDPDFRGRGWGRQLVELGLGAVRASSALAFRAEVREGNAASAAVFRGLGFSDSGPAVGRGTRLFRRER